MTAIRMKPRPVASLKLPRSVPSLLERARAIVDAMTHNPSFPQPDPTLDTVQTAILALDSAQTASLSRTRGAAQARDVRRRELLLRLGELRAYVQQVADGSTESAASIIESAGLRVHRSTAYAKPRFHVRQGALSDTVKLTAESPRQQAFYEWQMSTDGGTTWEGLPATWTSHTTVTGLAVGKVAMFRFRAVTRRLRGDWSQAQRIVVG
jgi:hypothetical protein